MKTTPYTFNADQLKLLTKIAQISKAVGVIQKDGKNPHFTSTYATFNAILDVLEPFLEQHNLVVFHNGAILVENGVSVEALETRVVDLESGVYFESALPIKKDSDAQKVAAHTTYYKRYNLSLLFNLKFEDDDDGSKASGLKAATPKRPTTYTKKTAPITKIQTKDDNQGKPCPECASDMVLRSGKAGEESKSGTVYTNDWAAYYCQSRSCNYKENIHLK